MDYHIDAKGRPLGRLASEIAVILQGKRAPSYVPRRQGGDRVLLSHVEELTVSGRKRKEKKYYRHTGYMGHLKTLRFEEAFAKNSRRVLREAVRRMLPKNRLARGRLKRLIFVP
jgi:large subunit ribosomal protein L13